MRAHGKRGLGYLLAAFAVVGLIGCAAGAPTIIGTWELKASSAGDVQKEEVEFFESGTVITDGAVAAEYILTEDGRLIIKIDDAHVEYTYTLEEDVLTLQHEGVTTTYNRK